VNRDKILLQLTWKETKIKLLKNSKKFEIFHFKKFSSTSTPNEITKKVFFYEKSDEMKSAFAFLQSLKK
jgi:hypothetical protein